MNKGRQFLGWYAEKTNKYLVDFLQIKEKEAAEVGKKAAEVVESLSALSMGGKRIRGALVVLGYLLCGGKNKQEILKTSIFVEFFHSALLIHDDFMDEGDTRRGMKAIHKQFEESAEKRRLGLNAAHYGESMAVNAGDMAFYYSWQRLLAGKFAWQNLLEATKIYTHYANRVVYGQILDVDNVGLKNKCEEEILMVMRTKSAEYSGVMPLLVGACLAGCRDRKKLKLIEEYGLCLGWAFQIQDDILGLFGDEKKTGKSAKTDLMEGKITLIIIKAMEKLAGKKKSLVRSCLGKSNITDAELEQVRNLLRNQDIYDEVLDMGYGYVDSGRKALAKIDGDAKAKEVLGELICYMMDRVL